MAMGLARMLGFVIPRNFDLPYCSRSISEFWRRWHITLGIWFRDYLYICLLYTSPPRFSPRGPVNSVDPWYRFHPLFFRYYWYKGILSQNQRTFNRQCIKLHARAPHRKSAQMPTHESFVHPFRLPHRGEERAHFNFCCTFAQQKTERPRGVVLSLSESLTEFRVRRRERCLIRFLPRPVRGRKHFARSERRIVRCQRTTEAQSAANLSRKSGFATFSTASENDPEGSFSVSL